MALAYLRDEVSPHEVHISSVSDQTQKNTMQPDASTKLSLERTVLSYERTMLSWVTTATSLITFGFSIRQFFRIARQGVTEGRSFIGPHAFGTVMILVGLLALLIATLQHRRDIQVLKSRYPVSGQYPEIPRSRATMLAALVAILGLLAMSDMLFQD